MFEEADLDSYEVYATADFQDDVRQFEEKDCVAERALLENGADTGGRLRWNEAELADRESTPTPAAMRNTI